MYQQAPQMSMPYGPPRHSQQFVNQHNSSQQHLSQQRYPSAHSMDNSMGVVSHTSSLSGMNPASPRAQAARPVTAKRTQYESATSNEANSRPKSSGKRKHKSKDKDKTKGEDGSGKKKKKKKSKAKKQEPEPIQESPRPPRRSLWSIWRRYLCGTQRRKSTLNVELNELRSPSSVRNIHNYDV